MIIEQNEVAKNSRAPRYSVLKSALIEGIETNLTIECVITDISKSGMRALLDQANTLPKRVFLTTKSNNQTYECEVVWNSDVEAGLRIVAELR